MSGVLSNELSLLKKTGSSTGSQGGVAAKKERNRKNRQERKQRKKNRLDSKLFEFFFRKKCSKNNCQILRNFQLKIFV